ncbi:MAG: hypothetical protein JNJ57_20220 [Saprospiraceae bacterium]|nr:hypothetical protein [Saprospiraceae bacterium]
MNNHFLLTDDMLWDYADGLLSDKEKAQVAAYLQQHPEHQVRLKAIEAEKNALLNLPFEKPNKGFADRVMASWVAEQASVRAAVRKPDWILSSITIVFSLFILGFLALFMFLAPGAAVEIPTSLIPEIPSFDWAAVFQNQGFYYGFMLILAYLGLQILDKYLQQKRRLDLR